MGDGDDKDLLKRMRVQANCAEYVPIGVILLSFAEMQGMPDYLVHVFGAAFTAGRLIHAFGLASTPQVVLARRVGMYLTIGCIVLLALANFFHALF